MGHSQCNLLSGPTHAQPPSLPLSLSLPYHQGPTVTPNRVVTAECLGGGKCEVHEGCFGPNYVSRRSELDFSSGLGMRTQIEEM